MPHDPAALSAANGSGKITREVVLAAALEIIDRDVTGGTHRVPPVTCHAYSAPSNWQTAVNR